MNIPSSRLFGFWYSYFCHHRRDLWLRKTGVIIIFLQGIDLFSAKLQSISLGKIVHKGIFSEFDFEVNAPRKQSRKSSFRNILKSFFWIQKTINTPSQNQPLQHSSRSICSKKFWVPPIINLYRQSSPLMKVGSTCALWHDHNYNIKTILFDNNFVLPSARS